MASKLYNLARMSSNTTGTGSTIALVAAVSGYLSFANAGVANGDVIDYAIKDGSNSEIGTATYSTTGPQLTGRTVTKSTNANAAINLSGNAQVFITPRAETLNDASSLTTGTVATARLGSGTANSSTALFGDQSYKTITDHGVVQVTSYGSGTITIPTGATRAKVRLWGGSGNASANACSGGGGGGGGGGLVKYLTGLTAGNTLALTVGSAASASTLSSGTQSITTLTANGGSSCSNSTVGAAGGTASNGDINVTGQQGGSKGGGGSDVGAGGVSGLGMSTGANGRVASGTNNGVAGGCIIEWYY